MTDLIQQMLEYADGELNTEDALEIEKIIGENEKIRKAFHLNKSMDEFMRVNFLLRDIQKDPELVNIEKEFALSNPEIETKDVSGSKIKTYITGALIESEGIEKLIADSENEISRIDIHPQLKIWVDSYMHEKSHISDNDLYTRELKDYIKNGLRGQREWKEASFQSPKRFKTIYSLIAIAATVIIAIGLWISIQSPKSHEELFAAYYQPCDIRSESTRGNLGDQEKLNSIIALYQNGHYEKTSHALEMYITQKDCPSKALMMYAISKLEMNEYESASRYFRKLAGSGNMYSIEATWYLALCELKRGNIIESKKILVGLTKTPGIYMEKASKLLSAF